MIDLYVNKYLRNDRLHINKNNPQSNWYKLLEGLSAEFIIFDKNLQDYKKDYNLNNTTLLIIKASLIHFQLLLELV